LHDNSIMEIPGRIQNGMVVFDHSASLPEGAAVTVTLPAKPKVHIVPNQSRITFPLVPSATPGNVQLTNAMIGEMLDEEDASA